MNAIAFGVSRQGDVTCPSHRVHCVHDVRACCCLAAESGVHVLHVTVSCALATGENLRTRGTHDEHACVSAEHT